MLIFEKMVYYWVRLFIFAWYYALKIICFGPGTSEMLGTEKQCKYNKRIRMRACLHSTIKYMAQCCHPSLDIILWSHFSYFAATMLGSLLWTLLRFWNVRPIITRMYFDSSKTRLLKKHVYFFFVCVQIFYFNKLDRNCIKVDIFICLYYV